MTILKSEQTKLDTIGQLWVMLARNRSGVRFSISKGAYIWNSNGRPVSDAKIQRELDRLVDRYHENTSRLAKRLADGKLSTADWQDRMRREIKDVHRTQYIIGRGGREQMTQRDWGRLGADLRHLHYDRLDKFALHIVDNEPSEAYIRARSRLYMDASNKQYWRGKTETKIAAGFVEEQRFLGPNEDTHCTPCKDFAAAGRVPVGTLPEPGEECEGTTQCHCTKVYYRAGE